MLSGYKTYITAAVMVIIAGAKMFLGVDVPGFTGDPGTLITAALGLIFARIGASNAAAAK